MKSYLLILKLALASIFSNKIRAFLTMLGIIIGVGSVIAIMSLGEGAQNLITGSIKQLGTNTLSVMPGKSDEAGPPASAYGITITSLIRKDAEDIEKIPHVTSVAAYSRGNGEIVYGSATILGDYSGVTYQYPIVENHKMEEGRFFTEVEERNTERVAVLGANLKDDLFPLSSPIGKKIRINDQSFKVIGLLERKGSAFFSNPDDQVIIPLSTAHKILLGTRHLSIIRLKVDEEQNVFLVKNAIQKTIRSNHNIKNPENDDFSVRSLSQALDTFTTITDAIRFFLVAIAAISLLVGGIGITNIMLMTIKERTNEIGLRKAIGATPKNIGNQFLLETIVITVIGGVIGIISGVVFSLLVSIIINFLDYDWKFAVPLSSVVISFIISALVGLTFGVYPARKAAKLNPIDALRYE